jgi:serine/threonine protein kinase
MRELSLDKCRLDKRYDIERRLGKGSYAEIFIARDVLASTQSPHSTVVIKALNVFLQDELDADLERTLVENFQNEAIALDRVRHPNIISRLGHGTARDFDGTIFHYLVLEYLAGGDLQKLARDHSLSLGRAMNYIEQVCAGLRHAHLNGVIHRDIKPQNLLLTKDRETVKIADFGVARLSQADTPITRVGTNAYAPPEHSPFSAATNGDLKRSRLSPASDIYSLAKSIYTLLTSESPRYFANEPITELPVSVREKKWASDVLRILKKATQDEPADRYQDIDEFWIDFGKLSQYVDGSEPASLRKYVSADRPQAHIARGYSPLTPVQPRFNTSKDLHLKFPAIAGAGTATATNFPRAAESIPENDAPSMPPIVEPEPIRVHTDEIDLPPEISGQQRKRRFPRRAVVFLLLITGFVGVLFATHSYLTGTGLIPDIRNPFSEQTATANTDIYLRPSPNTNNDPIGLVTKNSKVRIVNSQNNWYQVDVIEQGRTRANQASVTRGWLNGKYLDMD